MKLYLEVDEVLEENELFTKQPQNIRVEVSSKEEALQMLNKLKELGLPVFSKKYIAKIHYCKHEEGEPCEVEELEKVV